jgi:uncharacterized membrane protein HdeD (DUF308 family)
MKILERISAPTPKFWKKVQKIGILAAGVSAAVIASPVALPAAIVTAAGYLATVGGTITAISQLTVKDGYTPNNEEQ